MTPSKTPRTPEVNARIRRVIRTYKGLENVVRNTHKPPSTPGGLNWPFVKKTGIGNVSKCEGCQDTITKGNKKYPHDMVFRRYVRSRGYSKKKRVWFPINKHVHYHLDIDCVTSHDEAIQSHNIMASDEQFMAFTDDNLALLHELGYLESIISNIM